MIASLTGTVQYVAADRCVLDVHGVGYEVFLSSAAVASLPQKGQALFLHIYTNVREDALVLFGFGEYAEKEMFLILKTVSGIGPKLALAILSGMSLSALSRAIAHKDIKGLTTISGVGKKTAERISMELKEKVGDFQGRAPEEAVADPVSLAGGRVLEDALSALVNLGYPDPMARQALTGVKKRLGDEHFLTMHVEELIRQGLRELA